MLKGLSREQHNILGEKLVELGNLAMATLVFGQLLNEKPVLYALVFGIALYIILLRIGIILMKGEQR